MLIPLKTICVGLLSFGLGFTAQGSESDPIEEAASGFRGQVLIQIQGEVVYERSFGDLGFDLDDPIDEQTLFYIGSIAKTFTSTIVLQLVDEGKLSLDDPISKFLDDVPADKHGITIHQLLSHISGLVANHDNPLEQLDKTAFLEWVLSTELIAEPGTAWSYSNVGYATLAAIIEGIESKPFRQVVHQRVFEPASMSNAVYLSELEGHEQIAIGQGPMMKDFEFDGDVRSLSTTWLRLGAGGVLCTASDLAAFHRALQSEKLLSMDQQKLAATPVANRYGLGWRCATSSRGTPTMYHDGSFPGFNAEFFRLPIESVCIVVLSAKEDGAHDLRNTVLEYAKGLFEE